MMNGCGWVGGLGKGCGRGGGLGGAVCVWCWESVGKAVDVPTQHYSTYPHPIPIQHQVFPTYRKRMARQSPLSTPSTNSHPPYIPYIHPTQLHSRDNSTPTNPTRPSTTSKTLRTLSHKQTHPTSSQPDQLPHLNPIHYPTIPTPYIIVPSKPSPLLPLYAHPAVKTLISPNKAHMSLGRFCCALTIEYKCKTSHINKRLYKCKLPNVNKQLYNRNMKQ